LIGAYFGFACQVESDEIVEIENITGVDYETYPFFCETTWDPAKGTHCAERGCRQYNDMATIFLSSRENSILSLVEHPQAFSARSLALISVSFFLLMVIAFGAAIPGGIFMPTIIVGCTFGALFGRFAKYFSCLLDQVEGGCMAHDPFGQSEHGGSGLRLDDVGFSPHLGNVIVHTGPYALLGAVGLLGGIQRSSVSLVVIIVEGTGKVDYLLPIIFTTVCAKWVGDKLNDGIYHTLHAVKGIPFLENEPAKVLQKLTAQDLMHSEPVCLRTVVQVREVRNLLHTVNRPLLNKLHGFPVVKDVIIRELRPTQKNKIQEEGEEVQDHEEVVRTLQIYQGTILVDGLCALLRTKRFYRNRLTRSSGLKEVATPALELVAGAAPDLAIGNHTRLGSLEVGSSSRSSCSGTSDDDIGGDDSTDLEMQPLQRTQESPAQAFARKTLAALNKRADATEMIVEQTLLELEAEDLDMWLDIGESMNRAAYHVLADTPAHKVHRLFRTMGLRHLVVTDELNEVKGIITRADLIHHQH
jgi:chloride channel 7